MVAVTILMDGTVPITESGMGIEVNENGNIEIVAVNDIENSGVIATEGADNLDGGNITISAGYNIINNDGLMISARGQGKNSSGGTIISFVDNNAEFNQGAVIDVIGGEDSGDGGFIEFSAINNVRLNRGIFKASAENG